MEARLARSRARLARKLITSRTSMCKHSHPNTTPCVCARVRACVCGSGYGHVWMGVGGCGWGVL